MTNSQRLQLVRRRIFQWLASHGLGTPDRLAESILIRDGLYCGRRFTSDGFTAVWFTEDDQVKIYGDQNDLLVTFQVLENVVDSGRKAA